MVLNQEFENVCNCIRFSNGCFSGECSESKGFDGYECGEGGCGDRNGNNIADLLPNDPFGVEIGLGLANDCLVGMDLDISLPVDPFGMDFTLEGNGLEVGDFDLEVYRVNDDDDDIITKLNFVWTSSMEFGLDEGGDNEMVNDGIMEELICFDSENYHMKAYENDQKTDTDTVDCVGGAPADALFFALGYLGVKDLLSVKSVCKSLCDAVQNDPLLWRSIQIDYPLSDKITDDDLLRLTDRAQGSLHSLSLEKCLKITNNGLRDVLGSNLGLAKLSVPGCIKISVEGLLYDLKVFNSIGQPGIRHLRISELIGLTNQNFKEFKLLLGADEDKKSNHKPIFYRVGNIYLSLDDERAIDIETCPGCQQARQVYDCSSESCHEKIHSTKACRACISCIARCINCGSCLDNKAYDETFGLDLLCHDCTAQFSIDKDSMKLSTSHTFVHQKASYHFFFSG